MAILLEGGIIIGREHFAVGVNIHTGSICLSQKLFHILQIVTADKNSGAGTNADVYPGDFGIAIFGGVCLIEQSHGRYTKFSALHNQSHQFVGRKIIVEGSHKPLLKESKQRRILESEIVSMLGVSSHPFQTVN